MRIRRARVHRMKRSHSCNDSIAQDRCASRMIHDSRRSSPSWLIATPARHGARWRRACSPSLLKRASPGESCLIIIATLRSCSSELRRCLRVDFNTWCRAALKVRKRCCALSCHHERSADPVRCAQAWRTTKGMMVSFCTTRAWQ